jgi:tetratricopeptide (TPR) repeat protein
VIAVERWTGLEARALRRALRMTVVGFAEYLGVGTRTVSKWEARGTDIEPLPEMQAVLDTALGRADPASAERFRLLAGSESESNTVEKTAGGSSALMQTQKRFITVDEQPAVTADLVAGVSSSLAVPDWGSDPLTVLSELGRNDVDVQRRRVLEAAAYSAAALALPDQAWWQEMAGRGKERASGGSLLVGRADVDAVAEMVQLFSKVDQRRGGGHARTAVVQYLTSDVAPYLHGSFADDKTRRDLFKASSELAYLAGWMAFDNGDHAIAQRYFTTAVQLAAEADDPPLAGYILRAMAHQAIDRGHLREALDLATAAMSGDRYSRATPRERALIGVVHARALAANGKRSAASAALSRAEKDLLSAPVDGAPARVFFFGEASLAHETACTLRDSGDLTGAVRAFQRSVSTREAQTFTRTHAVTLGYLGEVQARQGAMDDACTSWTFALDAMDGVRSARARKIAVDMRGLLAIPRRRGMPAAVDLDRRAGAYLANAQ